MVITSLKIKQFRNLKSREFFFSEKRNLIYGLNGAGKTSILESIFIMAFGKSFLSRKKKELINYDADEFLIQLVTDNVSVHNRMTAYYKAPRNGGNRVGSQSGENSNYDRLGNQLDLMLNDKKATIFDINNYLYPVFFSSADYNLYLENKPYTRKMIDRFIFGIDSLYIRYFLSYNKALRQKNCLLKLKRNIPELVSWNKSISELCKKLIGTKMSFVDNLNREIKNKFSKELAIHYRPSLSIDESLSEEYLFDQLEASKGTELRVQHSVLGPHLDNFDITLNKEPLRSYSSGEKKIHLLMIYIAFIEHFKKVKNEYPVFLVDDFDTAIDMKNIEFLIENYPEMQVIATSVNRNNYFDQIIELQKEN